jgi:hypothetical protein
MRGAGVDQSVQCMVTDWTTGRTRFDPSRGKRISPIASLSRLTPRPTYPLVQWVLGPFARGCVKLTTHPF